MTVIYQGQPPPSKRNSLTDSDFLKEVRDFLEYCNILRGKLIILGDFNIHFDCPSIPLTSKMLDILSTFDIAQGVLEPTHRRGHIIDWLLYRESGRLVRSCSVSHTVLSVNKQAPVLCLLEVTRPQRQPVFRETRNLRAIDRDKLRSDLVAMVDAQPELTAQ